MPPRCIKELPPTEPRDRGCFYARAWVELRARRGAREVSSAGVAALRRAAERPSNEVSRRKSAQARLATPSSGATEQRSMAKQIGPGRLGGELAGMHAIRDADTAVRVPGERSEEHTSE